MFALFKTSFFSSQSTPTDSLREMKSTMMKEASVMQKRGDLDLYCLKMMEIEALQQEIDRLLSA